MPQVIPYVKADFLQSLHNLKCNKNVNLFGREVPIQKDLDPDSEQWPRGVIGGVLSRRVSW